MIMREKLSEKELLKLLKQGRRLNVKAPRCETPKNVYKRKVKHKRSYDNDSSFFVFNGAFRCSPQLCEV